MLFAIKLFLKCVECLAVWQKVEVKSGPDQRKKLLNLFNTKCGGYQWYRHKIKDLIDRDEQHRDLSGKFQSVIPRELYVLGFLQENAEARALGLCLHDIYEEIWP